MTEYLRGVWYDLQETGQRPPGQGSNTGVSVAGELVTWTLVVQDDIYLTGVRYDRGPLAGGGTVRFLIWQPSATTGHAAGAPVIDSGAVPMPTSGAFTTQPITFASRQRLPAGVYRAGFFASTSGLPYSGLAGDNGSLAPYADEGLGSLSVPGITTTMVAAWHFNLGSGSLTLTGAETYVELDHTGSPSGAHYRPATPNGFIQPWVEWQVAPIPPSTFDITSAPCDTPSTWDGTVSGDALLTCSVFDGFSVSESSATIVFTTSGGASVSPGSGHVSDGPWLITAPVGGSVAYHISVPGSTSADRTIEMCDAPYLLPRFYGGTQQTTPFRITGATASLGGSGGGTATIEIGRNVITGSATASSTWPGWTLLARTSSLQSFSAPTVHVVVEWWWRIASTSPTTITTTGATAWQAASVILDRTVAPHIGSTVGAGSAVSPSWGVTASPAIPLTATATSPGSMFWADAVEVVVFASDEINPGTVGLTTPRALPYTAGGSMSATVPNLNSATYAHHAVMFSLVGQRSDTNCITATLAACMMGGAHVGIVAVGPRP